MTARIRHALPALLVAALAASAWPAAAQSGGAWAVLIRNADTGAGKPPFALVDEFGRTQRLVEPVPGAPLDDRVGQRVRIRHDTGETLLATQLEFTEDLRPLAKPSRRRAPEFRSPRVARASDRPRGAIVRTQFDQDGPDDGVTPLADDPNEPIVLEELLADGDELPPPGGEVVEAEMVPLGEHAEILIEGPPHDDCPHCQADAVEIAPHERAAPPCECTECRAAPGGGEPRSWWSCPIIGDAMAVCDMCGLFGSDCNCGSARQSFVFADLLVLRATGGDVAHAQQQDGFGGAGTTPFGRIGVVDHGADLGFRVGVGQALDPCSDLIATYSFFDTDGSDTVGFPDIPGSGGAVGSLVQHPDAVISASVGPVGATIGVEFQTADLLYRHTLRSTCDGELNYLLGLQYGRLEQDFAQTGFFSVGAGGTIDTRTNLDFDGGGLKIGVDGQRRLGRRLFAYGRLTGAALSGGFEGDYSSVNSSAGVTLARAGFDEDRVVSLVEYELGLGWTSSGGRWHAGLGYQFAHWGNVITQPTFIDAVQANNYTDIEDTLTFDGAVGRVQFRW